MNHGLGVTTIYLVCPTGRIVQLMSLFLFLLQLVLITPIRRGTDLPLRERFFIQALSPADAAQRAKFSAQDMKKVKSLIDKNAWSFVQNGLRSSAGYLRYDLNTVITSKPKEERKSFKALSAKLFDSLNGVRYSTPCYLCDFYGLSRFLIAVLALCYLDPRVLTSIFFFFVVAGLRSKIDEHERRTKVLLRDGHSVERRSL